MKWNSVLDKLPTTYITGEWDGLKSDKVLIYTESNQFHIAEMYDGLSETKNDFYDERGLSIGSKVIYWAEIKPPVVQLSLF